MQTSDTLYCYNGDGLRMAKVTAGSCAAPTSEEPFTWDLSGSLPLLLVDGSTDYVYGPGGLPLEQISGSTTLWYHHDQIGSTRAVTDGSGNLQATYTFDPYGNLVSSTGSLANQPFLFDAQYEDAESSFYYLRGRYYDPTTGQFLSRDPAVGATRSPYSYVADNPLNGADATGFSPADPNGDYQTHCWVNPGYCLSLPSPVGYTPTSIWDVINIVSMFVPECEAFRVFEGVGDAARAALGLGRATYIENR